MNLKHEFILLLCAASLPAFFTNRKIIYTSFIISTKIKSTTLRLYMKKENIKQGV